MTAKRILIADGNAHVRQALRSLLEGHPGWEVCGEAADGLEAVEKAQELRPDLVLMDIAMPQLDGLAATRQIVSLLPETKVIILSLYESEHIKRQALEAGAADYVEKARAARELLQLLGNILGPA